MMINNQQAIDIHRLAGIIIETAEKFLKSPPTKQTIIYEAKKIQKIIEENR